MESYEADRPSESCVAPVVERASAPSRVPDESSSPWIETQPAPRFAPLAQDIEVDVAIVGGGITGITAAHFLSSAGLRVAVLEARRIGQGETGHTTAHLTAFPDARLSVLTGRFNEDHARAAWSAGARAIELIEEIVRTAELDCGFKRVPGFLFTETEAGAAHIEKEHAACEALSIPSVLERDGLPEFRRMKAALRFDDQAQIHPRQYLVPLAQAVVRRGGKIYEGTRVVRVSEDPTPTVTTAHGVVRARDVIIAANVPIDNVVLLQTKIAHYRSYALGLRTHDPLPDGLFWDDQDPYHYVRKHRVGESDLLIVGGEDHRTGQEADTEARYQRLLEWASERFSIRSVENRWSGQIIESVDGLPYIGLNAHAKHVFEATGFSGNGMTYGTIAARIIADRIQGIDNPWAELFKATRVTPIASAVNYVRENASTAFHLVKDHLAIDPTNLEDLPRGAGAVFNLRMKRVAAYRDEHGELHTFSPVCPHMHGIVAFNRAEKSWDCPCHGSRFDIDGEVINGPATNGLERISVELPLERRPQTIAEPGRGNVAT